MTSNLDPRNRVTDGQLDGLAANVGNTLWVLQPGLVLKDLRLRYRTFGKYGILYKECVIRLESDRADAFLINAGTPATVRADAIKTQDRRIREIKAQISKLQSELSALKVSKGDF